MPRSTVCITAGGHRERVLARRDALAVEHLHLVEPIARRLHAKLPPSFDLDDLIAAGNFALVRAATRYRPKENGGTPFEAYARTAIEGAIKDTYRRNKFSEQTRPGLDNVIEFPAPQPAIDERIDLARRFAGLRNMITPCLSSQEAAIVDEYYSPSMPNLAEVGKRLGISQWAAQKGHASAIRTIREVVKEVA